ncbi:beta-class carbonic anhydrase [Paenibacillus daejeonensis]|uniref:beta-class carbonic anhydrase n=1 Tax=Paenibacillus daejeonensis TaxID=135193 RepID=UPI001FDEBE5D|nr:carbonic anhydrase [Paenibacillus daejeonensis]
MILAYNEEFVTERTFEQYQYSRYPAKRMVIVTCMDARLSEMLPKAMNLQGGDAKIIKNAGGIVTQPFGNIMRSILVALYELGADEVFVIGHHECGMTGLDPELVMSHMRDRGISENTLTTLLNSGMDLKRWLTGFDSVWDSVANSVRIVRNHPLKPANVRVHGLIIDPQTGKLDVVVDGYEQQEVSESPAG